MKKLKQLRQVFDLNALGHSYHANQDQENQITTDMDLVDQYLDAIFPATVALPSLVTDQNTNPQQANLYNAKNLPFHLYDTEWLSQYTQKVLQAAKIQPEPANVAIYVSHAVQFDQARQNYLTRLIKAQTNYMLTNFHPNALTTPEYAANWGHVSPDYDHEFRAEVVNSMMALGIPEHTVEVVLEQSANLWRKPVMKTTFAQTKYPMAQQPTTTGFSREHELWDLKEAHESLWLKKREYEYFHQHHQILNELNLVTPNMKMSPIEKGLVADGLDRCEKHRAQLLSEELVISE